MPMWNPPPPSRSPPSSGQLRGSVIVQLDDRTVNDHLKLRGIPYNDATAREQHIALLSRAPTIIVPKTIAPNSPPNAPELAMLPPQSMQPPQLSHQSNTRTGDSNPPIVFAPRRAHISTQAQPTTNAARGWEHFIDIANIVRTRESSIECSK